MISIAEANEENQPIMEHIANGAKDLAAALKNWTSKKDVSIENEMSCEWFWVCTGMALSLLIGDMDNVFMNSMRTCNSVTFYFMKKLIYVY